MLELLEPNSCYSTAYRVSGLSADGWIILILALWSSVPDLISHPTGPNKGTGVLYTNTINHPLPSFD